MASPNDLHSAVVAQTESKRSKGIFFFVELIVPAIVSDGVTLLLLGQPNGESVAIRGFDPDRVANNRVLYRGELSQLVLDFRDDTHFFSKCRVVVTAERA
jgi:hypothetical protein